MLFVGAVIPASAENTQLTVSDMTSYMEREESSGNETSIVRYPSTDGTETINGVLCHWFSASDPSYYELGAQKLTTIYTFTDFSASHDYEVTFYTKMSAPHNVSVWIGTEKVYDNDFSGGNLFSKSNVKFTTPSAITDSLRVKIQITVKDGYDYGSQGQTVRYYISENLNFVDLTENPSWLQKILNKFSELGDTIGGFFDGLGERIGGFFSSLSESIGQWFAEQAQKIQDFKDGVKQWFQDLGDRIQQFFVDLYNDIVEGLKKLFIPSDGYFDSKKNELETFAVEHFGAMYQAPDAMVDMIRKFTTMSPKQPSITLPAIQFDFQGTRYVLSESVTYLFSWVNDKSNMLYYFYQFYRGFVTVILFLGFASYCVKKYNEVFGGSSE